MPYGQVTQIKGEEISAAREFDAFLGLAEEWELTGEQQITLLGSPGRSTYYKWKKEGGQLSRDTEDRVSNLLGMYKALHILFPDPERANGWIRRSNNFFGGRTALDVMLDGKLSDIISVRAYLDAQRGG